MAAAQLIGAPTVRKSRRSKRFCCLSTLGSAAFPLVRDAVGGPLGAPFPQRQPTRCAPTRSNHQCRADSHRSALFVQSPLQPLAPSVKWAVVPVANSLTRSTRLLNSYLGHQAYFREHRIAWLGASSERNCTAHRSRN